jgi:phosphoglycerol transferase MdoB-like AlkP superfamily enzyme
MNKKIQFSLFSVYIKNLFLFLVLSTALRLFFYVINQQSFAVQNNTDILLAILHGIRFDLAATTLCLAPWLLISIILYIMQWRQLFLLFSRCYLPVIPIVLIATNVADTLYFPFTGRRSGPEVFSLTQDMQQQGGQLLQQYWLFAISALFVCLFTIRFSLRTLRTITNNNSAWYLRVFIAILIFLLAALSIRSSLGSKPLSPSHAFNWPAPATGHLVLNSTFTLLRQNSKQLKPIHYFDDDEQAKNILQRTSKKPTNTALQRSGKQDNIVILVLESFASEYLAGDQTVASYMPFLNELSTKSLTFSQSYANGRRSIDALPAILAAIPPLTPKPFISSAYLGNNITGIAQILEKENYRSSFFHGAKNGSMYIDTMSRRFGFKQFSGLNEYPNPEDHDGKWGVFDEPFLQYMARELNSLDQPFIGGAFSLSSHNPYSIPNNYQNTFPKGTLAIHESIGYADLALKHFFETAKTMPWYENTLFIITGDHTSLSDNKAYQTISGRHQVPIILYSPAGKIMAGTSNKVAQHTDIASTILDYLDLVDKYDDQLLPFGNSLLNNTEGEAFFEESGQWVLVHSNAILTASDNLEKIGYQPNTLDIETKEIMLNRLKAKIQLFNNGMIKNDFH